MLGQQLSVVLDSVKDERDSVSVGGVMNMSGLGGEREVIHQGPKGKEEELFRDTDGERKEWALGIASCVSLSHRD